VTRNISPISNQTEMDELAALYGTATCMGKSIQAQEQRINRFLSEILDIPGHGDGGSYQHGRHQLNALMANESAMQYALTGKLEYANLAVTLLSRYADIYLKLGFQVQKNSNPPGRIFHQVLSEQLWIVNLAQAYGLIRATISGEQREHIENRLFHPAVELFTVIAKHHFDFIHNHGLWASTAVGLTGIVVNEQHYVDLAINGQFGDRETAGYLAQLSNLFAPSGYYVEGPYYHRFAIQPLLVFAEALHHHRPELNIYEYRTRLIEKVTIALISTTYPDGRLPALNDASRGMDVLNPGLLIATAVCQGRYEGSQALVALGKQQGTVWVQPVAIALANSIDKLTDTSMPMMPSIELCEGPKGDKGAQGFLRMRSATGDVSQLIMNYGQHGLDHGHFDTLGITWFNKGDEVLREYGYARWVNVEIKYGGRYLKENNSWAKRTIAHNTVVIDGKSQNDFKREQADAVHGLGHFFKGDGNWQAMSAFANEHYAGVNMQRTVLLITLEDCELPVMVDLYRLSSQNEHIYDYPVHYKGQICQSTVQYKSNLAMRKPLGNSEGFQHLFLSAQAKLRCGARITWLQDNRFNSWHTAENNGELLFTELGANDPDFNLRHETAFIVRTKACDHLFASVFETHGSFDEGTEVSVNNHGMIREIKIIGNNDTGSVVEVVYSDKSLLVMVANQKGITLETETTVHFKGYDYSWKGAVAIQHQQA